MKMKLQKIIEHMKTR